MIQKADALFFANSQRRAMKYFYFRRWVVMALEHLKFKKPGMQVLFNTSQIKSAKEVW